MKTSALITLDEVFLSKSFCPRVETTTPTCVAVIDVHPVEVIQRVTRNYFVELRTNWYYCFARLAGPYTGDLSSEIFGGTVGKGS